MDKISTLITPTRQHTHIRSTRQAPAGPSDNCMRRLRQFARAYCPTPIGGIIMN